MNKETLLQIGNCAICPNMCRFDCPTNNALRREGVSPAGKMRLAYMLEQGLLAASPAVVANLYQCLGCRGCETWCPFPDLSVADLLVDCRIPYAQTGQAPAAVYEIKKQLDASQTLFAPDAMQTFPAQADSSAEVLLFAGCAYRKYRPQAIQAAFDLLQAAGVRVTMLEEETCCGFPAGCLGVMDTTGRLAGQMMAKIQASGAQQVVTLCPECFSAFSRKYPSAGVELGVPVRHFAPYVLELLETGRLSGFQPFETEVAWHDPCVLGRGLKLYEEPRELLSRVPGLHLKEARYNREQAHCCGAGQLYDRIEPQAAAQIARVRSEELELTHADLIVTVCPFCEHQLGEAAKLPVVDLAEVLWEAYHRGQSRDYILEQQVRQSLAGDPVLAEKNIQVMVEEGLVKLAGQVDTWAQVVHCGLKAGQLPRVYSVVNNLQSPENVPLPPPTLQILPVEPVEEADVVIIGGGVVGCALARELSRYDLKIVLLEKASDLSTGASKANNGMIHPGIFVQPGTLKARLNVRGVQLYPQIAAELDFPLQWCGLMGVVIHPEAMFLLEIIKAQAEINGIHDVQLLSREEVLAREPRVTKRALGGFFAPGSAMTSPYKVTVAYAENAVQNGAKIYLNTPVTGMQVEDGTVKGVYTPRGLFSCRQVINAAGIYADQVAAMAGEPEFTLHPRRGELLLFDQKQGDLFTSCLAEVSLNFDPHTKGGGIMVTVDGNIEIGPTAEEIPDREDVATTGAAMERVRDKFAHLVEGFDPRGVIAYFSGLRAATYTEDFHIRPSRRVRGLLNVAGIQSPGLAAAPAIAEYVLELLAEGGLPLIPRPDFNPHRRDMPHFKELTREEQNRLIRTDQRYGRVVCRCETVTEGEIVAAIHRPVPATTLDAVKRRTRAGMGRCQGGFCTPRVAAILARETGVALEQVTKEGAGSWMFVAREGGCQHG